MKKLTNPFRNLTKFERILYILSSAMVTVSGFFGGGDGFLSTVAGFLGVTALIFVARGEVLGQILTVVFSVLYAVISYTFDYYGEMITYVGMTAPIAAMSVVSWLKHPYLGSKTVEVARTDAKTVAVLLASSVAVTFAFYFILRELGTASLWVSTLSVTTSFLAASLQFFRSPYYAVAYACNDIVLIVLWVVATVSDRQYISMVVCFTAFLMNDIYGFYNWNKMQKSQSKQ